MKAKDAVKLGLFGSIVAAICCFTPLLVVLLGVAGLTAVVPFLDPILLPLLAIFLIILGYGLWKLKSS